jgi:hypothetical protein
MELSSKTLRPYQARLLADVCRATCDVLVEQPTGSGKTMQIVTLVAMQLGQRFTHAIISAPQEQIEHGFVHRDYERVEWSRHAGVAVPAVEVPEEIILASRKSYLGSVRQIRSYLRLPGSLEYALACTHAALNHLTTEDLPDDLSGKALFIDEAHHASANGLSQLVSVWRKRRGQLFFFTATPYRGDGRAVALPGMRLLRRSLAEHMAEGFAPGHLDSEIVALGNPGDSITAGQFTGEDAPPASYFDGLVQAICRKWVDDGKPKAIVRVPPMRGGSQGLVSRLIHALSGNGARVHNATGTGAADKQRFLAALSSEKNRTFADSNFDIIVGIQRVMEGTDWPVCSAVYCVGMLGSLNTVVQLLGRAMRPKGDVYPSSHRDRARLVFFVPCGGGAALGNLSIDHSRHALLTCCFLADHEVGQEWIVLREVRRGIEAALGTGTENPAAADAENEADEPLDPEVRAEVELAMVAAREQIINSGGEPAVGEVVQLAAKTRPDLPKPALHRVAAEILAAQASTSGSQAREAIHSQVTRKLRINPVVKEAMEAAFAAVLQEFRAVTLKDSAVLESVGRQIHEVTGGQMREFARRLSGAVPRPLTEKQILAWADAHYARLDEWPNVNSGPVYDAIGETWSGIYHALHAGSRGLPGGSSLAQLLAEQRGVPNRADLPPLTISQILTWARAHHQRTARWPIEDAGPVQDVPGETWGNVSQYLRAGVRGLPGGSSLAKLLAEQLGVKNQGTLPKLTIDQILLWADAHYSRTGCWPNHKSGTVDESPSEKWSAIEQALQKGVRGLSAGSSLAKLIAEHRTGRHRHATVSVDQILEWADAHHSRTGEWPHQESGPVQGVADENWTAINTALMQGLRGLARGSSLSKLLTQHRAVRNKKRPPQLTVDQILVWADAHRSRTGEWPHQNSGPLHGVIGENWTALSTALSQGLRGLTRGSSISKLLIEHRGVSNRKRPLTIDQILAWAEAHRHRTGKWPTPSSGPVSDGNGENWAAISRALRRGHQGLPGGLTLARLDSKPVQTPAGFAE